MHYYLYKVTNNLNGKIYVGVHKTHDLDDGYMGSGKVIRRAIEKHGPENFTKEILQTFDSAEEMFEAERELVTEEFLSREDVYNLRRGGSGGFDYINKNGLNGYKKARDALSNLLLDDEQKQWWISRIVEGHSKSTKVRILSDEALANIRESNRTRTGIFKHTEEAKQKISEANLGKIPWNLGIERPDETKQKISEALKGKPSPHKGKRFGPRSEETKEKIRNAMTGRKLSEETKEKIRAKTQNKPLSEESKQKISIANKGRSWYNNGVEARMFKPDEVLAGFVKGRKFKNMRV